MKNIKTVQVIVNSQRKHILMKTPTFQNIRRFLNGEIQNCNHTIFGKLKFVERLGFLEVKEYQ